MSFCIIPSTQVPISQETQGVIYPPGLGHEAYGLEPRLTEKTGSSCLVHGQAVPFLSGQSEDDHHLYAGTWNEKSISIVHTLEDDEDPSHTQNTDPTVTENEQTAETAEQLRKEKLAIRHKSVSFLKRRTKERLAAKQREEHPPAFTPEAIAPGLQTLWRQRLASKGINTPDDKIEKGKGKQSQAQTTTPVSTPPPPPIISPNMQYWYEYLVKSQGAEIPEWVHSLDEKLIFPPWDRVWTPLILSSASSLPSEDSASWSHCTNSPGKSSATAESMVVEPRKVEPSAK